MPATGTYDLQSPPAPRLAGRMLRLSVRLLECGWTRGLVMPRLLRQIGVTRLRELPIEEEPTGRPLAPPSPGAWAEDRPAPAGDLDAIAAGERCQPDGFAHATVRDYAQAYRRGAADPEQVARAVVDAIAASDRAHPPLRAFIACHAEDVMAQARASAQRLRDGRALSLFDGVPVAVKDELDVRGYGSTAGTRFLGRTPAAADATAVARMRAAGAVLIGKTNMHEIGIGVTGMNPHHGPARNPHNPAHHTGGSSSGSAAAVAAGFCPVAIGADGGGSIRIPAGLCGVVGLKPTHTRVSAYGAVPLDWSVAHVGPLAASVEDAAMAYALMAGADPNDPATLGQPPVTLEGLDRSDLTGLTLGVYRPWFEDAEPDVVAPCEALVRELERRGARLCDVELPDLDAARVAHLITISTEMAEAMRPYYEQHRKDFALETRANLALARSLTAGDYIRAQRVRSRAIASFQSALAQADCILTPTTACTAPAVPTRGLADGVSDLRSDSKLMRFAFPGNLTGLPAISLPAGFDATGLPVGLQAIGQYWREHVLLRLARVAESFVPPRRPSVAFDTLTS